MKKKAIHQDVFIGFFCLILCGLIYALNRDLPSDAALMPKLLDGMLAILSVLIINQGLQKSKAPAEQQKKLLVWEDFKVPMITWGIVALYVVLFYVAGYFVATAVIIPLLMRYMKLSNWKLIIAIDVGYLLVIYFVFVRMLGVSIDGFGLLSKLL